MDVEGEYLKKTQELRRKNEENIIKFFMSDAIFKLRSRKGTQHIFYYVEKLFPNSHDGIKTHRREGIYNFMVSTLEYCAQKFAHHYNTHQKNVPGYAIGVVFKKIPYLITEDVSQGNPQLIEDENFGDEHITIDNKVFFVDFSCQNIHKYGHSPIYFSEKNAIIIK